MYWLIRYNQIFEKLLLLATALKTPLQLGTIQNLYGWLYYKLESMPKPSIDYAVDINLYVDLKLLALMNKLYKELLVLWAELNKECVNLGIKNVSKSQIALWCKKEIAYDIAEKDGQYFTENFAQRQEFDSMCLEYHRKCLEKEKESNSPRKEFFELDLYKKLYGQYGNKFMAFMHNEFHRQLSVIYENLEFNTINKQLFEDLDLMEQFFLKKTKNNTYFIEVFSLKDTPKFIISSNKERAIELVKQLRIIKNLLVNNNDLEIKKYLKKRILYLLHRYPQNKLYFRFYKFQYKK